MNNPAYQMVEMLLQNNAAAVSAAEAHGMVAGMFCVTEELDRERWRAMIFGDARNDITEREWATVDGLCQGTRKLLEADDFSFELFLPDGDASMVERAAALAGWCQGFLRGVGYAGSRDWSKDCDEFLSGLADISLLDSDVAVESDEVALTEIREFVRVGVQFFWDDLRQFTGGSRLH